MDEHTTAAVLGEVTARPPFDPELAGMEQALRAVLPRLSVETLPAFRGSGDGSAAAAAALALTEGGAVRAQDRWIPGPAGAPDLTVLILSPVRDRGPKAAIYHIHGGGMVSGDRWSGVRMLLPYVAEGDAVVVSVEHRLAPEHPDPAPVQDCYAGLTWVAKNASELGVDPGRLLIIGGSSGGGLAAGTALLARDRGFPRITHQILSCPMLDDRFHTHSSRMLDGEGVWDRNSNLFCWNALLGDRRGGPDVSVYAAPARARDLTGLPRTYIDVGSADGYRDEAMTYARRLCEAGVNVDFHLWGGAFHGFDMIGGNASIARAANATRENFIRRALGAQPR